GPLPHDLAVEHERRLADRRHARRSLVPRHPRRRHDHHADRHLRAVIASTAAGASLGGSARNGRGGSSVSLRTNVSCQPFIDTGAVISIVCARSGKVWDSVAPTWNGAAPETCIIVDESLDAP